MRRDESLLSKTQIVREISAKETSAKETSISPRCPPCKESRSSLGVRDDRLEVCVGTRLAPVHGVADTVKIKIMGIALLPQGCLETRSSFILILFQNK